MYWYSISMFFRLRYLDFDFSNVKRLYNIKLFFKTLGNFKKIKKKLLLRNFFTRFRIFSVCISEILSNSQQCFVSLRTIRLEHFYLYNFYRKYKDYKVKSYLDYITYMWLDFLVVWQYYTNYFFYYWYRNLLYRLYFILVEDYLFRRFAAFLAWSKIRNYSDKIEIFVEWVRLNVPGYEKAYFYEAELVIEWSIYTWCLVFFFYFYTTSPLGVLFLMEAFWTVKFWPKIFCHLFHRGYSKRFWLDRYWNKKWYKYPMWYFPYLDFAGDWRPFITYVTSPSQFYVYRYYYVKDFFIRWRIFYYILYGIYNVAYVSGGKEIKEDFFVKYPYYMWMLRSNLWPSTHFYSNSLHYKYIFNLNRLNKRKFNFSDFFIIDNKFLFSQEWYLNNFKVFFKLHLKWFEFFKSEKTGLNLLYYIFFILNPLEYRQCVRQRWFPLYWPKKIILFFLATGINNPMIAFVNRWLFKKITYLTGKKTEAKHYFFYYKIDKTFIFYYLNFFKIFTQRFNLPNLELFVKSNRYSVYPFFHSNYNLPNLYFNSFVLLIHSWNILSFLSRNEIFFDIFWNIKVFLKLYWLYKYDVSNFRNNIFYNIYLRRLM